MKFSLVLEVMSILQIISNVNSFPVNKKGMRFPTIPTNEQMKFMQRFGYLEGDQPGFEAQYTESSIAEAIVSIQKFGGLNTTGVFDEDTVQLMRKRRCGVKDVIRNNKRRRRYAIAGGWKKRELTYFLANWTPKIGEEGVHNELRRAFNMWAGYGNLTFIRTKNPSADIVIAFGEGQHGDPYPFDGMGNILAHAFFPYYSYGGQVHFDNAEHWTIRSNMENDDKTDFFSVASHELGHALGLGHSEVSTSIMNPYYKEGTALQLDYDDVMAMYQLYIRTMGEVDNEVREITPKDYDASDENEENEETTPTVPAAKPTEENHLPETTTPRINFTVTTEQSSTQSVPDITFHGDYETVDVHKEHDTKHGLPVNGNNETTNLCDGKYDCLANLRGELFVFKEKYVWRFEKKGKLAEGYPVKITNLFPKLPDNFERIDAVYEKKDGTICFFIGNQYWLYRDELVEGPRLLTDFQISSDLESIDSVFIWSKNERTYLFKNAKFWRFDETTSLLDNGYPKSMTRWRGIPSDLDAAINWTDGITYFFKGALYWKFDNQLIKADKHYPLPAPQYWFGCPENFEKFKPEEMLIMGLS